MPEFALGEEVVEENELIDGGREDCCCVRRIQPGQKRLDLVTWQPGLRGELRRQEPVPSVFLKVVIPQEIENHPKFEPIWPRVRAVVQRYEAWIKLLSGGFIVVDLINSDAWTTAQFNGFRVSGVGHASSRI